MELSAGGNRKERAFNVCIVRITPPICALILRGATDGQVVLIGKHSWYVLCTTPGLKNFVKLGWVGVVGSAAGYMEVRPMY